MRGSRGSAAPRGSAAYEYLLVRVESIVDGIANCSTSGGTEHNVPIGRRVGAGGWPQPGDTWLLAKVNATWVFHLIVDSVLQGPIEISSPRDSMDAGTEEIFDALIRLGLVKEQGGDYQR